MILGPIIGPTLGGWLTENFSWRWVLLHQRADRHPGLRRHLDLHVATTAAGSSDRSTSWASARWSPSSARFQLMIDRGPSQDWFGSTRDLDRRDHRRRRLLGLHRPDAHRRAPVLPPRPGQGPQLRRLHLLRPVRRRAAVLHHRAVALVHAEPARLFGPAERLRQHAARRRLADRLPVGALSDPPDRARAGCWRSASADRGRRALADGPLRPVDDRRADHDRRASSRASASACCSRR